MLSCGSLALAQEAASGDLDGPAASQPAASQPAASVGRLRATAVLVLAGVDASWPSRVRGQLSDTDSVVLESATEAPNTSTTEPVRRLARQHGADMVAWLSSAPEGGRSSVDAASTTQVWLWLDGSERLYARRLGRGWSELSPADRSAALEIAALTVRSAVRSLESEAAPASDAEPVPPDAPRARTPMWRLSAAGGWQLDGQTRRGFGAAGADVGARWGHWSWAVGGLWGFEAMAPARGAELSLTRHSAYVESSVELLRASTFALETWVRVGIVLTRRATRATAPDAFALPPETQTSALLAAGVRAPWHFTASQALSLSLGAAWPWSSPRYAVQVLGTGQRFEYPFWRFQPVLELRWSLAF